MSVAAGATGRRRRRGGGASRSRGRAEAELAAARGRRVRTPSLLLPRRNDGRSWWGGQGRTRGLENTVPRSPFRKPSEATWYVVRSNRAPGYSSRSAGLSLFLPSLFTRTYARSIVFYKKINKLRKKVMKYRSFFFVQRCERLFQWIFFFCHILQPFCFVCYCVACLSWARLLLTCCIIHM